MVKERMQVQRRVAHHAAAGAGAGAGAGGGTYYRSGLHAVRTIMRSEGLLGLYRVRGRLRGAVTAIAFALAQGYGATLMSFGPFSAIYFVLYEAVRERTRAHTHTVPHKCVCVCVCGGGAPPDGDWVGGGGVN